MIILIGLPGSGKSTVGRQLARRLSASFVDSDHVIEQRLGCSIREYFEREGEQAFRDVEQQVIGELLARSESDVEQAAEDASPALATPKSTDMLPADLQHPKDVLYARPAQQKQQVLATGGGAVLRESNRQALRAGGYVIYLRSSADDLYKRLRHDQNRPLLQVGDPQQRLRQLFEARDPLYRETAHLQIDTGRPSVATLVNLIVMHLDEIKGGYGSSPR